MTDLARKHLHPSWTLTYDDEVEEEELDLLERARITVSMPRNLRITSVVKVMNPYLWCCYQLKKAEYINRYGGCVREMTLYHATSQSKANSIIKSNLDWRLSQRVKYGKGVSFSPSPSYANKYCNMRNGIYRAMIVVKVLVNVTSSGSCLTKLPSTGTDTSVGNCGQVYVKYNDNEFYPEYVIYYTF